MVSSGPQIESGTIGDLFSLFTGGDEPPTAELPVENAIAARPLASEPQATTPDFNFAEPATFESPASFAPPAETISLVPLENPPEDPGTLKFDRPGARVTEAAPSKRTQITVSSVTQALKQNKKALYAAFAAATVLVVGGIAWLSTRGSPSDGKPITKSGKKNTKSSVNNATTQTSAHEVTLHVGAGGEFKSIARALYSAAEGRAEYEAAAKGKPLRFLISVKPGPPFEESLVFDNSFPGEVHLFSETGKNFSLKSPGDEPAISIKNLSGVTIENVSIDLTGFPPKDSGIVVSGAVARCRIKNCVISGAGKSGIELNGAVGGEGTEGVLIESVTFQNAAPTSSGVHVAKSATGSPTQRATVQRCRFISSMSAAVLVEGPADSLTIRHCGATSTANGVRFSAGVVAKNVLIDHCSFRNQSEAGLRFDAMPGAGAGDFVWRNCLFSGVKIAELLISKDYNANNFNALMSADKPSDNNWSDRKIAKAVSGERDLLGKGGERVPLIQFESTSPNSELFLVAKPGEPYKSAGIKAK